MRGVRRHVGRERGAGRPDDCGGLAQRAAARPARRRTAGGRRRVLQARRVRVRSRSRAGRGRARRSRRHRSAPGRLGFRRRRRARRQRDERRPVRRGAGTTAARRGERVARWNWASATATRSTNRPAARIRTRSSSTSGRIPQSCGAVRYQHAVRAPSVEELYSPEIAGQFVVPIPDPCSVSSPQRTGPDQQQVEALCLAQGLPPALLPTYNFVLRRVDGVSGGNPDLEPEEADTLTVGIVLDPSFEHPALADLQARPRLVSHRFRQRHRTLGDRVGGGALLRCGLQPRLRSVISVLHVLHPGRHTSVTCTRSSSIATSAAWTRPVSTYRSTGAWTRVRAGSLPTAT